MQAHLRFFRLRFNHWRKAVGQRYQIKIFLCAALGFAFVEKLGWPLLRDAVPAYLNLCDRFGTLHVLGNPRGLLVGVQLFLLCMLWALSTALCIYSKKRLSALL
jgi:hypothetical protein